jgi:2-dehydro-3-deoxyglucarate aldolase/4-hydroxy-2-oxoheptanedioate aldolase
MLNEQDLVVGLMVQQVCAPWVAKVYADAGADFVYIENEHMFFNEADLGNLILSCRLCGLPVVAKSSYVDRGSIAKLLDAGVTGIQLPMSESAEQLAKVVSYTKFPPAGIRAAAPGTGNTNYEPVDTGKWLEQTNKETTVIAHIESRTGLEHVDEILQVTQVDIMFIGMFDLSVSMGQPARYDHPNVVKAMKRLVGAAKEHGKVAGMWAPSYEAAEPWVKKGVRFIETTGDVGFIAKSATALMKCFPGHGPKVSSGDGHI